MDMVLTTHAPAFQRALDRFKSKISAEDREDFKSTTLEGLKKSILNIQQNHAAARKLKDMNRLSAFLTAMDQFGKIIEVFLNTSEFVAFVWVSVTPSSG